MSKRTKQTPDNQVFDSIRQYKEVMLDCRKVEIIDFSGSSPLRKKEQEFYDYAQQLLKDLRSVALDSSYMGVMDSGNTHLRRRAKALSKYAKKVQEQYLDKYPELSLVQSFYDVNAVHGGLTYDLVCSKHNITYAVALWMLDALERKLCVEKATEYFPSNDILEEFVIPDYTDSCHDSWLIKGMMYLIENRNNLENKEHINATFVDDVTPVFEGKRTYKITELAEESLSGRQKFDSVMAMIPEAIRDRAAERFIEKEWEALELCFDCMTHYRKKEISLADDILREVDKYENIIEKQKEAKSWSPVGPLSVKKQEELVEENLSEQNRLGEIAKNCATAILKMDEERHKAMMGRDTVAVAGSLPDVFLKVSDDQEMVDKITSLSVKNPYETAFALLLLLDSGSDMPWLYTQGLMVVQAAAKKLPWAFETETEPDPGALDEEEDEIADSNPEEEYEQNPEEKQPTLMELLEEQFPTDWIDEEEKLYAQIYNNSFALEDPEEEPEDSLRLMNLPQVVFENSDVIMPRNVSDDHGLAELFEKSGFDIKESKLMERMITLASSVWLKDLYRPAANDYPKIKVEEKTAIDSEDLKEQIKTLKANFHEEHREKNRLFKHVEDLESQNEQLKAEIEELRTMIHRPEKKEKTTAASQPDISFPYNTDKRYVVFGGHDSWSKIIRQLLPKVRFVNAFAKPEQDLVLNADTVWIQNNAISHSAYYKIMNVARAHKIPVKYFNYSSAEKCAEQLALYDMKEQVF